MRLVLGLTLLLAGVAQLVLGADDPPVANPFGLPRADSDERPGTIILHGGGAVTQDVFEEFVARAGGAQARIVFVPSAGWQAESYENADELEEALDWRFSSWTALADEGEVAEFRFLYTDDPEDADNAEFLRPLEEATGVWFSGGDQVELNYRYVGEYPEQTRFQRLLRRVLERGGVVGGTSAGMAALPEIMTLWQEREDLISPAYAVAGHGLGLLDRVIVEQHFDTRGGRLERFTSLLKDSDRLDALAGREGIGKSIVGIAVEEDAAAILSGDLLEVLGEGKVHVFRKSRDARVVVWHEITSGDSLKIPGAPASEDDD